jgi:hypothetical protein
MAPKRNPASLGNVAAHDNGFRVRVKINGSNKYGPYREDAKQAREDLRKAREAKTHDEYAGALELLCREATAQSGELPADASAALVPGSSSTSNTAQEAAAGSGSLAQRLTLRGLNIQYPFSQLILEGHKTIEARRYSLGHRKIANPGEELFLIETPQKCAGAACTGDAALGPEPQEASVVGTIEFSHSTEYSEREEFRSDADKHCVREGAKGYDWSGEGEMHAWHIASTRRVQPILAGDKTQTGFGTPRTFDITFAARG